MAPGLNLGPASEPWPESRSLWMHRAEDEGHPHPTMSPGGPPSRGARALLWLCFYLSDDLG